ncbi:MAG: replication factor C large subunit [Nanoarchaeota archaeon]|nr:replication factor C large subunit [Nanoarchaeota archaeon]
MIPWTRKYRPENTNEVQGHDKALAELKDFILNFKNQKKKAALIYGSSGVGKTCSAYAIANDLNYEVFELNASDFRNKNMIESRLGSAMMQRSLFSGNKIILIDEIDGLSGKQDRGGVSALAKLIDKSMFPVIMTATNPYDGKLNALRKKANLIQFYNLNYLSVFSVLKNICTKEKIKFNEVALKSLARHNAGDLRSAINDLQTLTHENKELKEDDLKELSDRNRTESMLSALMKVFKTTDIDIAIKAFENVEEDIDKQFLWIDQNLPEEYQKPEDLARAYDYLSKADVFKGRIRRWQYWRFLVYVNAMISAGVAVAKDEKYRGFTSYKPTTRILKLWRANMKYQKRKSIASKIAEKTHTSSKRALQDTLPYLSLIFKKNKELSGKLAKEFELDKDEVEWLKKG